MHNMKKNRPKETFDVSNYIPIVGWLPKYEVKKDLVNDIIGGVTIGILHVPQGMAYSSLAGLKPVNGLYTSLFPALIYMIFGTSRHVSIGVFAVVSLMSGACNLRVTKEVIESIGNDNSTMDVELPVEIAKSLGLLVGFIQIILFALKANHLVSYLSDQIIFGFITGAAVHVFTAQINKIIGVSLPRHNGFGKLFKIYHELINKVIEGETNLTTFGISISAIIVLYALKYHVTPALCAKTRVPIPYDLFVIILGTVFSKVFNLNDLYDVKIIGKIPTGLPLPAAPKYELFGFMISDAIAIAVVSMVITISMGKVFASKHKYELDVRQEFLAMGIVSSVTSLFPCWPPSTALARTIINDNAGTKTQLSAIFSAIILIMVLFFIGPFMESLPTVSVKILNLIENKHFWCLLSCIVIVALRGMFLHLRNFKTLWKQSKIDWAIFAITFVATVIYDVVPGLLIGAASALTFSMIRIQRSSPYVQADPESPPDRNTLVVHYSSSLFYFNCEKFERRLDELIKNRFFVETVSSDGKEDVKMISNEALVEKLVIFDMAGVANIDVSGVNLLLKIRNNLEKDGVSFRITHVHESCLQLIKNVDNKAKLLI